MASKFLGSQAIAAPLPLTVQSVLVEGDSELRDIKPQAALPIPADWPMVVAAGLLAAGLLALVVWWLIRRYRRDDVDNRPAHQVACDELDRISVTLEGALNDLNDAHGAVFIDRFDLLTDIQPLNDG